VAAAGAGDLARESAGFVTASAAPAPSKCANRRREIELLFMGMMMPSLAAPRHRERPKSSDGGHGGSVDDVRPSGERTLVACWLRHSAETGFGKRGRGSWSASSKSSRWRLRGAQAASLLRPAACRTTGVERGGRRTRVFGRLPKTAGWQPALPGLADPAVRELTSDFLRPVSEVRFRRMQKPARCKRALPRQTHPARSAAKAAAARYDLSSGAMCDRLRCNEGAL
jgi:hypothetical protein